MPKIGFFSDKELEDKFRKWRVKSVLNPKRYSSLISTFDYFSYRIFLCPQLPYHWKQEYCPQIKKGSDGVSIYECLFPFLSFKEELYMSCRSCFPKDMIFMKLGCSDKFYRNKKFN